MRLRDVKKIKASRKITTRVRPWLICKKCGKAEYNRIVIDKQYIKSSCGCNKSNVRITYLYKCPNCKHETKELT